MPAPSGRGRLRAAHAVPPPHAHRRTAARRRSATQRRPDRARRDAARSSRSHSSAGISSRKRLQHAVSLGSEHRAPARGGEVQLAHGARDADVEQAALLLQPAFVERARVREHAVLAAGDEHGRILQALGVVQRHQRHQALVLAARVGVRDERDLLQEQLQGVLALGGALASNSRATSTSCSRFSIRPWASIARSASSAST